MSLQTPHKTSDQKSSKQLNGSTVAANTVVLPTRSKAVAGGSWFGGGNRRRGTWFFQLAVVGIFEGLVSSCMPWCRGPAWGS